MRKARTILLLTVYCVLLQSCTTDAKHFQNSAISFAEDGRIDDDEYTKLVEQIKTSGDGTLTSLRLSEDQIDATKVCDHLVNLFSVRQLNVPRNDVCRIPEIAHDPFDINVFIENSASMDGYVKGVTEFETAIYDFLSDIKISDLERTLNLHFINRDVTFTKKDALPDDLKDFIAKLEPSTFAARGGDRGISDLQTVLEKVLESVNDSSTAILVSDFVFSPGRKRDAKDYLNNQTVGIKVDFAEKIKNMDLSVMVIQLESAFDGIYFDKQNNPVKLNCKRPYYIWLMGPTTHIRQFYDNNLVQKIQGGFLNRLVFSSVKEPILLPHKTIFGSGSFTLRKGADGPISGAIVSKANGVFEFAAAVNFNQGMENDDYFLDPANYKISNPNYKISIEPVDKSDPSLSGLTHKLILQSPHVQDEILEISLMSRVPKWVNEFTSTDDAAIACTNDEVKKTFALSYLVTGVYDAFYPQADRAHLYKARIQILK